MTLDKKTTKCVSGETLISVYWIHQATVIIAILCGLQLLKKEEDCREKPIENACIQIVDCLVENVLQLEEKSVGKWWWWIYWTW